MTRLDAAVTLVAEARHEAVAACRAVLLAALDDPHPVWRWLARTIVACWLGGALCALWLGLTALAWLV